MLYSRTKGVKQKYMCISIQTVYRQYIHTGSDPQIHNWLTSGESILLFTSSASYISPQWLTNAEPIFHYDSRMLSQSSPLMNTCKQILSPLLWTCRASTSLTPWIESAEVDPPYQSLNTALLASQPQPRRVRISQLAPVLIEATQFLYQAFEPQPPRIRIQLLDRQVLL